MSPSSRVSGPPWETQGPEEGSSKTRNKSWACACTGPINLIVEIIEFIDKVGRRIHSTFMNGSRGKKGNESANWKQNDT